MEMQFKSLLKILLREKAAFFHMQDFKMTEMTNDFMFLMSKIFCYKNPVRFAWKIIGCCKRVLLLDWHGWTHVRFDIELLYKLKANYVVRRCCKEEVLSSNSCKYIPRLAPTAQNYKEICWDNLNLWEICKSSICNHLLKTEINEPYDFEIIESYYQRAIGYIEGFKKFYLKQRPHAVVVDQGFQYDMRIAVEIARRFDCKTIAVENSCFKNYFFMDSASGGICNRHSLSRTAWDTLKARVLTSEQSEKLRNFMLNYTPEIDRGETLSDSDLRKKILGGSSKKIALLFAQVATDSAIVMDSYLYKEVSDFIMDTVHLMACHKSEYQLVIRLHPKEAWGFNHQGISLNHLTLKKIQTLGIGNFDYVSLVSANEVDTYQLMNIADVGLTINSQAGLEFLYRNKPLIVLGDAFYAHKGFTCDVGQKESFGIVLNSVLEKPYISERQKQAIEKFLYHMIFEYLYPKNLIHCEQRLQKLFD